MADIKVEKIRDLEFRVEILGFGDKTTHHVTVDKKFVRRTKLEPEELVRRSFEFLLERETKEYILPTFSIPKTILSFFSDFESEMIQRKTR